MPLSDIALTWLPQTDSCRNVVLWVIVCADVLSPAAKKLPLRGWADKEIHTGNAAGPIL